MVERIPLHLAERVRLVILDVDGVMTDGGIYIGATASGEAIETKRYEITDGLGIHLLQTSGVQVAIVTGRESESVRLRAVDLGVAECHQDASAAKLPIVTRLLTRLGIGWEEVAFVGDDLADIPVLKQAFRDGLDIHAMTASEMFGVPIKDMPSEVRRRAKAINFGIIYGISAFGLANQLGIGREEASAYIKKYFERFPGIRAYIGETLTHARESGFTTTLFGRKTHFPRLRSNVQHERQGAERAAINAPIQGTAADIIKRAMARMGPALAAEGLGDVRMLMQVHDELVFEVPEDDVDRARDVVRRVMESAAEPAVKLSVPLGVEVGVGPNWGAAH